MLDAIAPDAAGRPIVTALFLPVIRVGVLMMAVLGPVYAVAFALLAASVVLLHALRLGDRVLFASFLALLFVLEALGYLLASSPNLP